jgi:hypothetical protein
MFIVEENFLPEMWKFRFNKKRYGLLIAITGSSESLRDVNAKWYPCTVPI